MNLKELARKAISTLFLSMLCLVAFAQDRQANGIGERHRQANP